MGTFGLFKYMVMVSFFWSFFVTTITSTIPAQYVSETLLYSGTAQDMNGMAQGLQTGLSNQKNIPVVEFGALVYYSGTYLVDLMVNFLGALPQMVGLMVAGIFLFVPLDSALELKLVFFVEIVTGALYIIGFVSMLANMRSSGGGLA